MSIRDRIRERRLSKGWTEEDFERARERRQKIWTGIKIVGSLVPIPAVSGGIQAAEAAKDLKNTKNTTSCSVRSIALSKEEVLEAAIDAAIADPSIPQFDKELGELLKNPMTRIAIEMTHRIISELEARVKIDLSEELEKAIFDLVLDLSDDISSEVGGMIKSVITKITSKIVEIFKRFLFGKSNLTLSKKL